MNKKTKALTTEQYKEIIQTMKEGFCGCRPNERVARVENLHAGVETLDFEARHRHTLRCRRADCVGDVVEQGKRCGYTGAGIGGDRDGVALECGAGIVE